MNLRWKEEDVDHVEATITGFCLKDVVSWGNTGIGCLDESSHTIVKSPHGHENEDAIMIERRIYERASAHVGHFLCCYGSYELGIRLELAYSDLRPMLQKSTDIEQRLRWAKQTEISHAAMCC